MTGASVNPVPEVIDHYNQGREEHRLVSAVGQLEYARTQELLLRVLPSPPASVVDVGGGSGVYAFWLASLGDHVHLVDATPLHIEQAQRISMEPGSSKLASLSLGDVRGITFADDCADAVLLMGPLYHLVEREDWIQALRKLVIATMTVALQVLDGEGFFGIGAVRENVTLFVTISDAHSMLNIENASAQVLSPAPVFKRFTARYA